MSQLHTLIVMGVAGSGKTTLGKALETRLAWPFFDADAFHPEANIKKMAAGVSLDDYDRWPWLDSLQQLLYTRQQQGKPSILACSALKAAYRERLSRDLSGLQWVYLQGKYALIEARMQQRQGHYMKAGMLASQFAVLEPPQDALCLDVSLSLEAMVDAVQQQLATT